MKNYDKNKESSCIQYLDANNLYGWAMSQKLPVNGFKWINDVTRIDEQFIQNYDEDSDKGYILEIDIKYPKKFYDLHSDLPFLPERMKIDKCKKLVCNLRNKKYVVHIRSLKQALNHGLKLKKVHRIIEFNQKAWLKPDIDMNTELRKIAKSDFKKDFFKLMSNAVYGKTMENVRKHRDIKLLMYEVWYGYMKPKYDDKVKLCYTDIDSFIMSIKTKDFYKDIADDVEKRFDTSNYEVDRPLPTGKNKKVIGLRKDELGGRIIREFVALGPNI